MLYALADGGGWQADPTEGGKGKWGEDADEQNWDEPYGGEGSGGCYYGSSSQPHNGHGGDDKGCYASWEEEQYDPSYVRCSPSPLHILYLGYFH